MIGKGGQRDAKSAWTYIFAKSAWTYIFAGKGDVRLWRLFKQPSARGEREVCVSQHSVVSWK